MLETARILLRPANSEDWPTIFEWRNTEAFRWNIMSYEDMVSYDEFCGQISRAAPTRPHQFLIIRKCTNEPIGYTYARDHSDVDGSCFVNVYIKPQLVGRGFGVDAFALILEYLFKVADVASVKADVFGYNSLSLSTLIGAGARQSSDNPGVRQMREKTYDVIRFEFLPCDLPMIDRMLARLNRQSKGN